MIDDEGLLLSISRGDEIALGRFFDLYKAKVYGYLLSFVKLQEVAEELTLDVFLKIWQKKELLAEVKEPAAFLFVISKHKALDFLKAAARNARLQQLITDHITNASQSEQAQTSIAKHLEQKELITQLLNELSPQRKEILILSRLEGLSHVEIAQKLKISRNTVKNTITQTLRHLERVFNGNSIETCWIVFILGGVFLLMIQEIFLQ
ncbi:RNA polymerase [Niabella soli DSM 19437]|uniref:RNA polymerase n=2 Tax=Niabella TaxID=379899 RepID=W0F2V4_9BACT|nr:RNA polymerase [Niabella soli DSM 19437]